MAKRRAFSSFARSRFLIIAAALLIGGGIGLGVSFDRPKASPPSPPRPTASAPAPRTPVRPPAVIEVHNPALDAAVQRALGQIGSVELSEAESRSGQIGAGQIRWTRRTLEVRLSTSPQEATAVLRAEVERAGGQVFAAGPTGVQVGLFREGIPFVTHMVRFARVPAQGRVVIIFDDAGGSLDELEPIIALSRPVTVSILPGLRYSREVAARAQAAGLEVFLHLPVEPEDANKNLGPGAVMTAMTDTAIATTVLTDLAWVPGAAGMNNHMGSLGTADPRVMRAILTVAKERGLIFLDSVTTPRSVAARLATEMRVPTATRDVFVDNVNDPEAIREALRRVIVLAKERGTAVGIGHVQRMTARILMEMLPEFDREGIELVPVSTVVHRAGNP